MIFFFLKLSVTIYIRIIACMNIPSDALAFHCTIPQNFVLNKYQTNSVEKSYIDITV